MLMSLPPSPILLHSSACIKLQSASTKIPCTFRSPTSQAAVACSWHVNTVTGIMHCFTCIPGFTFEILVYFMQYLYYLLIRTLCLLPSPFTFKNRNQHYLNKYHRTRKTFKNNITTTHQVSATEWCWMAQLKQMSMWYLLPLSIHLHTTTTAPDSTDNMLRHYHVVTRH